MGIKMQIEIVKKPTLATRHRLLSRGTMEPGRRGGTYLRAKLGGLGLIEKDLAWERQYKQEVGALWLRVSLREGSWGTTAQVEAIFKEDPEVLQQEVMAARQKVGRYKEIVPYVFQGSKTVLLEHGQELPEKYGIRGLVRGQPMAESRRDRGDRMAYLSLWPPYPGRPRTQIGDVRTPSNFREEDKETVFIFSAEQWEKAGITGFFREEEED